MITELQARDIEINSLKEQIKELQEIVNANKDVLFDLLEVLQTAEIPYRSK